MIELFVHINLFMVVHGHQLEASSSLKLYLNLKMDNKHDTWETPFCTAKTIGDLIWQDKTFGTGKNQIVRKGKLLRAHWPTSHGALSGFGIGGSRHHELRGSCFLSFWVEQSVQEFQLIFVPPTLIVQSDISSGFFK